MTNRPLSRHLRFAADLLDLCDNDIDCAIDHIDRALSDDYDPRTAALILDYDPSDSDIDLITRILDSF